MTAIADLVALLVSTGISTEFLSQAIDLAQRHAVETVEIHRNSTEIHGNYAETTDERRRRKDRERKRKNAENEKSDLYIDSSKKDSIKEESKKEPRAKKTKLVPLPENWLPPASAYPLATEHGTTVPHVEAIFRDYLKSSGRLYANHDAAFCNFIRNQRKFAAKQNAGPRWNGIEGVV